jgi:hypothetical protein
MKRLAALAVALTLTACTPAQIAVYAATHQPSVPTTSTTVLNGPPVYYYGPDRYCAITGQAEAKAAGNTITVDPWCATHLGELVP